MSLTSKLAIGSNVLYEGQRWSVKGFIGGNIQLSSQAGQICLLDIGTLADSIGFKVLDATAELDFSNLATFTNNLPTEVLKKAEELLEHLNEVECGYKSGNKATALPTEPRFEYDFSQTTLRKRIKAKSIETGISTRSLWEWKASYLRLGIYGLIDLRHVKERGSGSFRDTITPDQALFRIQSTIEARFTRNRK